MDFQKIADSMTAMTCVVSVETFSDERNSVYRIVTGNRAYIDSIEHPAPGTQMLTDRFIPDQEYTAYLTRDLNFEDYCYRAAVEKKCLHSYAHPDRMDVWFNMMFIPLESDDKDLHYCLYMMEINFEPNTEHMSNISAETASSVLDTCIRLRGTNDFKATMKDVLKGIRDLCDAEHCCILVMNELERSCFVLGEAFAEGTKLLPMEHYVDDDFYDIAESWGNTIAGSNCLIAKNDKDMQIIKERNPVWYDSLTGAGAYNIVLFPLKSRNELLGYMWALNFDPERSTKIKETLEVTTFIIGSELGNYFLLDRLRMLSSRDMLTGVMNRNEMNLFVDKLCHAEEKDQTTVGVIFADLNGLKQVNDLEGHNAGDRLLKNAANALREIFDEKEIYRAGGDEFSIILTGIDAATLKEKITRIRKACEKYGNVVFAIGGALEDDSRNVRMALRRADESMYEDKRQYYEEHPDRMDAERQGARTEEELDEKFRERSYFREMNYDHLTGLPSMTYFFKLAEIGRKNMYERQIPSALVYINLSGLRYFNKRYGFAEGDALIKEFAALLASHFGEENCSRFGQDHFALFTEAETVEQRLKRLFIETKRINGGRSLPVRAGIYKDSMGLVEVSLACDRAKYASNIKKDDTNSTFNYYDDRMLSLEINRQYIVDNLDRAIAENWVRPFYQPIVRALGQKVCDEEALARWIDPEKGMLSPADFIPILEDTKLIYKVDLHMLDVILERIRTQQEKGIPVVPVSINLSRTDFETCDIVEEINNRFLATGVSRDLITIEITESVVGENFNYMKEQVERFQQLGFKVWMDDFGSGYSSLDLLQEMQFDLIKFDMRFMRQFETTPKSRVILTELMRMTQSLGIETICEGVETEEQASFLREIGCTKLQGYYFCKPIPVDEIWSRFAKGTGVGFENPDEADYQRIVGAINMYDLSSLSGDDNENSRYYFDTLPIAAVEYDGNSITVVRSNKSYREFMTRFFAIDTLGNRDDVDMLNKTGGGEFVAAIERCSNENGRVLLEERLADGTMIQSMVRKVTENPVSGVSAYVIAVLDITPARENTLSFAHVAEALSSDYIYLYHVNIETDQFVEYSADGSGHGISLERRGENFFVESRQDIKKMIYEADKESLIKDFTKEKILAALAEQGSYVYTYRLMVNDSPTYVNMKIARMNGDKSHIIIGVSNVDNQMRQQEAIERLKEEQITYSRISALMGDFIAIYTVDPVSGNYMQYSATKEYSELDTSKAGMDFFKDSIEDSRSVVHPEDLPYLQANLTKEKILERTQDGKVFKL
nr:EAL domain-containing protein [Lachnospiraceae bacterium]